MDLMIRWSATVRNRRLPISVFMGTLATDDRDKDLKAIWEFVVLREYRMGDCHEVVMRPTWSRGAAGYARKRHENNPYRGHI